MELLLKTDRRIFQNIAFTLLISYVVDQSESESSEFDKFVKFGFHNNSVTQRH